MRVQHPDSKPCTSLYRLTSAQLCFPQIDLYAGALFVHICLGWNFYLSTILTLTITALYTIAGMAPEDPRGARDLCRRKCAAQGA